MAAKVGHKLTGASLEAHVALRSSCRAEGLDEVVPVPHVVGVQLLNKQINKYSYSIVYIVIENIGVKFKFY